MDKVKVAVIGYGYLGKWHAQKAFNHELCDLVAIVEASQENQQKARELSPELKIVASIDEVLDAIDAAIIVTPTSTHFSLVDKLLRSGKHVFCEKPLTDSFADALRLKKIDKKPEQVIQIGHSERFHPVWNLLKNDKKFEPFFNSEASIVIDRYAPFKGRATDVDVVSDLMIHDLDLIWFLFKEKPTEILAKGHKVNTDKWDHVTAQLSFSSGRRATITSGRCHVEEQRKLQIICNEGALLVNLMDQCYSYAAPFDKNNEIEKSTYTKADHLLEEQDAFYNSILNKSPSLVTIDDGVEIVSWIDAVQASLEKGTIVKL